MIARIWRGWTTKENAKAYELLFKNSILPHVTEGVGGYIKTDLLRKDHLNETEFTTIFWFDSYEAVKEFAGDNYEIAVVPQEVKELMLRFDETVQHYESVI